MKKRELETREKEKAFAMLLVTLLVMFFIATVSFGVGRATANSDRESVDSDQKSVSSSIQADENSIQVNLHFTDDYIYECWGRIQQVEPLAGCDYSVMAVQPVKRGGEYYEEYGWRTYYISNEILKGMGEITYGDEAKVWKITAKDCDESGGFVHLPELIISAESVESVEDIPEGYGA